MVNVLKIVHNAEFSNIVTFTSIYHYFEFINSWIYLNLSIFTSKSDE